MGIFTPNLHLYKPVHNEVGYDDEVNTNFDILDTAVAGKVGSVFGRTGDVAASANDYAAVDNLLLADTANESVSFDTAGGSTTIEANNSVQLVTQGPRITLSVSGSPGDQISMSATNGVVLNASPSGADNSLRVATTAFVKGVLPTTLPPNGTAGGDLSGTYPNPTVAKINGSTPAAIATSGKWSDLQNASAALTLANGTNNTTFNHTSAVTWTLANTTAALAGTPQSSPILTLTGNYWTGSVGAADSWTFQVVVASGTNGASTLTIGHSGSSGAAQVNISTVGNGATFPMLCFGGLGGTNWGLYRTSGGRLGIAAGGSGIIAIRSAPTVLLVAGCPLAWSSSTTDPDGTADTGISRLNAGTVCIGTGANGSAAGNLQLNRITGYNGETPSGVGVPYLRATTQQKAETGADANVVSLTPLAAAGLYRIVIAMAVSAATAATLGWTVTYTDSNGVAQAPTNLALKKVGVAADALTFAAAANDNYYAEAIVDINNGAVNIVVKTTFAGTSIAYKVSAVIERLQ